MQFPNDIQVALLFDRPVGILDALVRSFTRLEEARTGARFAVPEAKPGVFYRLFGGGELMITLEYLGQPAKLEVFEQALASPITGILCPDIRQRLTRNRSHILINVSHGVFGGSSEVAGLLATLGMGAEGHSLPQFVRRLDVCALLARLACEQAPALAVHWTQSNQLLAGETFDELAAMEAPSLLHVHPRLSGGPRTADGKPTAGFVTFGARHFIGGEVIVEPNVLPWAVNYETVLAFLRVATTQNGYIIPDGDTFGPEDRSFSYRVVHRGPEGGDVPVFELRPLLHREYGFEAEDYVPPERVFDDRMPPADLMPPDPEAKMELANEWREKRALAEGIGGRFEVRARNPEGGGEPPPPGGGAPARGPWTGTRPVFGRKKG